jgi:hypothetical protein
MIAAMVSGLSSIPIVAMLASCVAHTDLHLPLTPLSPDERVALFNADRGESEITKYYEDCDRRGNHCVELAYHVFELTNGDEIVDPADLLPMVAPTSEAANHIHTHVHNEHAAIAWAVGALVSFFGGGAIAATGAVEDHNDHRSGLGVALISVGGVIAIGGLITGLSMTHHYNAQNELELVKIIANYDGGLAEKLNVCVDGLKVVPCEQH